MGQCSVAVVSTASWLSPSLHVQHVPACILSWYKGLLHIRLTGDSKLSLNVIEHSGLVQAELSRV